MFFFITSPRNIKTLSVLKSDFVYGYHLVKFISIKTFLKLIEKNVKKWSLSHQKIPKHFIFELKYLFQTKMFN